MKDTDRTHTSTGITCEGIVDELDTPVPRLVTRTARDTIGLRRAHFVTRDHRGGGGNVRFLI